MAPKKKCAMKGGAVKAQAKPAPKAACKTGKCK